MHSPEYEEFLARQNEKFLKFAHELGLTVPWLEKRV